jgi:tryptophanyl-tRNA synthetase
MRKGRILTGMRPTGKLHLGHYVGALKNWVRLQDEYECFFLVADLHVLTTKNEELSQIQQNIHDVALDYLSVGIDPAKVSISLQSLLPETAELHLLFSMLTTVPRLQRIPSLKDVMRDLEIEIPSYGLLGYPVLQTADICLMRANLVPVGKDQASHIEVSREIARRFNQLYGDVFPEPEALIGDIGTLVGTDGQAKMSKSIGNAIMLSDPPEEVERKVRGMFTDPKRLRATDPGTVEGNPVFIYHDAFNPDTADVDEMKARYREGRIGDVEVKRNLAAAINAFLAPIRERRAAFEAEPKRVRDVILEGTERAAVEARETVRLAKQAMGILFGGR